MSAGRNPRRTHAEDGVNVPEEYFKTFCGQCQEKFARALWSWWWMQCGSRDCPDCVFLEFEDSPHAGADDHDGIEGEDDIEVDPYEFEENYFRG